ncbi:MAG: AmmeMemoRadiSam system protein B [Gemmataceae bacterium]
MLQATDRPRLRQGLAAARDGDAAIVVWDNRRITHRNVRLSQVEFTWAQLLDGRLALSDLQQQATLLAGGSAVALEHVAAMVAKLDDALLLESPKFLQYLQGPVRDPSCIGCYAGEPDALHKQIDGLFTGPGGPGPIETAPPEFADGGPLRALLVPHMDFGRGNVTYGWGFKDLFERTSARLFVIIATSHYSTERFTLTRQHFRTPLGTVETDQKYVDRIVQHYGDGLFNDPVAHLPEHSIELEVVILQHLYRDEPFRIVPLLCGSFGDAVQFGRSPRMLPDISRMVTALQQAEAEAGERICYVISGDLAHIGPKFSDPQPVAEPFLTHSKSQDDRIVARAEQVDADGYFTVIAEEGDRRRICGLPPTWLTLAASNPKRGKLLHYGRFIHPQGYESVSFASMAFVK